VGHLCWASISFSSLNSSQSTQYLESEARASAQCQCGGTWDGMLPGLGHTRYVISYDFRILHVPYRIFKIAPYHTFLGTFFAFLGWTALMKPPNTSDSQTLLNSQKCKHSYGFKGFIRNGGGKFS
jgi:hypothetical protein